MTYTQLKNKHTKCSIFLVHILNFSGHVNTKRGGSDICLKETGFCQYRHQTNTK